MKTKSIIIAFSGIDCAGKSTQIEKLSSVLADNGHKTVHLWTRGGYTYLFNTLKTFVRKVLGNNSVPPGRSEARSKAFKYGWVQKVWLNLAMLDLAFVYGFYFRWLKLIGRTVIADRYLYDTWIDFTLNFPTSNFHRWSLWKLLKLVTPRPDHAFLLLISVDESLRRSKQKNEPFPDSEELLQLRLINYQKISDNENWEVIDCTRSLDEIAKEIETKVLPESTK